MTPSVPQATFVEEPAFYRFSRTFTANEAQGRLPVNIDRDSDFLLTGINGTSDDEYTINFRLPSGRLIGSDEVTAENLVGTANQPTAIGPPPIYRAGSTGPELAITNLTAGNKAIELVFTGIRRLRTA